MPLLNNVLLNMKSIGLNWKAQHPNTLYRKQLKSMCQCLPLNSSYSVYIYDIYDIYIQLNLVWPNLDLVFISNFVYYILCLSKVNSICGQLVFPIPLHAASSTNCSWLKFPRLKFHNLIVFNFCYFFWGNDRKLIASIHFTFNLK